MCPKMFFFKNLVLVLEMAVLSVFGENIVKELKGICKCATSRIFGFKKNKINLKIATSFYF